MTLPMSSHLRVISAAVVLVALAGCSRSVTSGPGDASNLEEWVANVSARAAPQLEPLPVMQQFETFHYADQAMRDPFSITQGGNSSGLRPNSNRRREILEQYPLENLKMVGTIGSGADMVALVMAPDNVTYRLPRGAYLGQNEGRITGIQQDRINLVELVSDGASGWLEIPATVTLNDQ